MGKENDAMLSFLEDNERFADLFNTLYFMGNPVVKPEELKEASEVYVSQPDGKGGMRIRDIKKRLEAGTCLKVLALEGQTEVNYCMPWRIMEYDCREYGRQVRDIQRENRKAEVLGKNAYANSGEWLGKFRKNDRIAPVYTLCLYHGTEKWDGPRSLKDMMNFGIDDAEKQRWENGFADYPMRLICVNELKDCFRFSTSLGIVFALLPFRKDKAGLEKMLEENAVYRKLDEETARTIGVFMGVRGFMEHQEKYKDGEGYNMCQAIQEMMEDSRVEGREQSKEEGICIFIRSNRDDGVEENAIVEKLQKYYFMSEEEAWRMLQRCE